nr:uncharacterized protein si:ch211-176l24.4 isoform X1 [Misgurnus anguillicaudatus]
MSNSVVITEHAQWRKSIGGKVWLFGVTGQMASFTVDKIAPDDDSVFDASKIHKMMKKSKKPKKEKKDKNKTKCAANILLHVDCDETDTLTQTQSKKRKKSKKKKFKLEEDFQLLPCVRKPKPEKRLKQSGSTHTGLTQDPHWSDSVICISPDQVPKHSSKSECQKEKEKAKKRVVFNLPPEQNQAANTKDEPFPTRNIPNSATSFLRAISSGNMSHWKQLIGESSLESQTTAEEVNSQDLFITQKSFLDPSVDLSSSPSGNEISTIPAPADRSCRLTAEASTQTENFFSFPELSNSLRFQQQQKTSVSTEEPVDLSLPNRARQMQSQNLSAKHSPKLKISDTSSEDSDIMPKTKSDLSQLKVIQTRLNESFFFKVKGYDSPKPICPLMKLTESAEKKAKK